MSYCESCGRELRAGAAFCGACGAKALPALVASSQVPAVAGDHAAQPPAPAAAYTPPVGVPGTSSGTGVTLVVFGAALAMLSTFMYYYWYSYGWPDGSGADQGWSFGFGTSAWTRLWPPKELFLGAESWSPLFWFQQITWIAAMITTLLCVAAAVLAVLRAGGARINGSIIPAFGIAALVAIVANLISGLASEEYRWFAVTDLASLAGAILIIIGGGLLGPASTPASAHGAPLPARGPAGTY